VLYFYSSSGIDDVLCSFVFSGYYSVVKHIVHKFAAVTNITYSKVK